MKNLYVNFSIPSAFNRMLVHKSVSFLKKELKFDIYSLIVNFVSSEEILEINKKYLGHDYITDIITFNYSETKSFLDGEIYISYEEMLGNSQKYGCGINEEATRMVTHGILHLLGYDDIEKVSKKTMKDLENKLVKKQNHSGVK